MFQTKLYKNNQTNVPQELIKKYNLSPGDILEWLDTGDGAELRFRKKVTEKDIIGLVKEELPYNSVELKKSNSYGRNLNL